MSTWDFYLQLRHQWALSPRFVVVTAHAESWYLARTFALGQVASSGMELVSMTWTRHDFQ